VLHFPAVATVDQPSTSSSGAKAARYPLGAPLGEGGQGRTYRSVDAESGRAVAVKVIQLGDGGWKPFDLFERECQVLRALDHPAIPRYLDTFALEEQGRYFLVMELVEGTPLQRLVRARQPLPEAQLWNLLHQGLGILDYLHGLRPPVVHRDLKPANFIQRPDGRLALVDFGGVRVALRPDGGSTVVGSFGYMAPEQLHGEATPATDIYGLGATLAALATGTEADKLPRQGLRADLGAVMPASPLREVLQRMLEPDPTHRPASTGAVRALLAGPPARREQPSPAVDDGTAPEEETSLELGGPVRVLVRVFGSLGYVGFLLLDAMVLPLVVFILSQVWSKRPQRVARLREQAKRVRGAMRSGRKVMGRLARAQRREHARELRGRRQPRQLPPRRRG